MVLGNPSVFRIGISRTDGLSVIGNEGTLCKYATAYVDTHRRNVDLAGTLDAEKK